MNPVDGLTLGYFLPREKMRELAQAAPERYAHATPFPVLSAKPMTPQG